MLRGERGKAVTEYGKIVPRRWTRRGHGKIRENYAKEKDETW